MANSRPCFLRGWVPRAVGTASSASICPVLPNLTISPQVSGWERGGRSPVQEEGSTQLHLQSGGSTTKAAELYTATGKTRPTQFCWLV